MKRSCFFLLCTLTVCMVPVGIVWPDGDASCQAADKPPDSNPPAGQARARAVGQYGYKLDFSTFLGGSGFEDVRGLTLDAQGNIYACGPTMSRDFPTTPGAHLTKVVGEPGGHGGHQFVAKFSPAGKLIWSTLLGNPNACEFPICMNVKVDAAGFQGTLPEAWFANAFQKTPHVHPTTYHEGDTGIIKVSGDGTKVHWATWIGGSKGNITKASVCVGRDHCPVLFMPTASANRRPERGIPGTGH
jgi:hypothetical protein